MKRLFTFLISVTPCLLIGQYLAEPTIIFQDPDVAITKSIRAADLDNDGLDDVLMCSADLNVFYLKNLGDGSYSTPRLLYNSSIFGEVAEAADMDGDGDLDVVAITTLEDRVLWIENISDGLFDAATIIDSETEDLNDLTLSDMDRDGDMDIFISTYNSLNEIGRIIAYENDGGNFAGGNILFEGTSDIVSLVLDDFDSDGWDDLMIGSNSDAKLSWKRNNQDGTFGQEVSIDDEASVRYASTGDMDGDGDIDLVIARSFKLYIYFNDGNGNFEGEKISDLLSFATHVADLTGNGSLDIISGNLINENIEIYINDGDGDFSDPISYGEELENTWSIDTADMDGDGDEDVLTSSALKNTFYLFDNITTLSSINDIGNLNSLNVYPNPNQGEFSVDFQDEELESLSIRSISGVRLQNLNITQNGSKLQSYSTDLPSGIYVVNATLRNGRTSNFRISIVR